MLAKWRIRRVLHVENSQRKSNPALRHVSLRHVLHVGKASCRGVVLTRRSDGARGGIIYFKRFDVSSRRATRRGATSSVPSLVIEWC